MENHPKYSKTAKNSKIQRAHILQINPNSLSIVTEQ